VKYLVDTNVISELRKRRRASPLVRAWIRERKPQDLFLSVLTLGELRRGAERVERRDPASAVALRAWLDSTRTRFRGRIVDVDTEVADRWGRLGIPDPLPDIDGLLAATALVHGMTVVTRNVHHIAPSGARCLNPFQPAGDPEPTEHAE
jgi:predicted nucleic acid-binding protein